ncbi:hypothetical protein LTR85_006317 [Meristemomyces frigidus]|nr:hypothetical protein LTR85_006317 [Meristemomyces frigidus]
MQPPSRKRSHEDMRDEGENTRQTSAATADEDLRASQVKPSDSQIDSSVTILPSTPAHTMQPPAASASSMLPPAHKPPRSGQGTSKPQAQQQPQAPARAKSSEKAAQSTQNEPSSDATIPDDDMSAGSSTPSEPQDRIEGFDWQNLQERYHARMRELDADEHAIFAEFEGLCNAMSGTKLIRVQYFAVWANTSQTHEVDRSYKRLKTQMTYVQHAEDELEQKRGHYIKVVEAFKSALLLLGD